ncbi:hypothetical protein ACIPYQ_28575 [Streptomyces sp. NPDC090045]
MLAAAPQVPLERRLDQLAVVENGATGGGRPTRTGAPRAPDRHPRSG